MVLVFGAAGFIGTYLVDELLRKNFKVIASDNYNMGKAFYEEQNIPYIQIDITNKNDFEKINGMDVKAVIHLAALQPANVSQKKYDPADYIRVNTIGTLNVLEYARIAGVERGIFAYSHRNTHGLWSKGRPIKEEEGRQIKYDGEYAMFSISESAAQDCIEHYRRQFGSKNIIFRLPPVYGYGPHMEIYKNGKYMKTGFLTFIENAIACKPLEIWGNSSIGRDIIYVKDVVSAFIQALNSDSASGLYNIASGELTTLKQEAELIAKVFWGDNTKPIIIERPDIPLFLDSFLYDISNAKRDFNWQPAYDFEAMLYDYKKEMDRGTFSYLVRKRKMMFDMSHEL